MIIRRLWFTCACTFWLSLLVTHESAYAQQRESIKKQLQITPKVADDYQVAFRLLPSEEDQEPGNAVPVLLRMIHEQQPFMQEVYPKLHEFAEMDMNDPRWKDFRFARFADQIVRAGSMSFADWQYPLRSDRPHAILLPDIQSQRQLAGRGMTAWIRLLLSQGKTDQALEGIRSQLACGRHCAATPVAVCHLVGLAIANMGFDNLELAIQSGNCPNMYWSLASLPPTLQDLGPMVRWELWATPTRLNQPLPAIGSEQWGPIANRFVAIYAEYSNAGYTIQEGEALQRNLNLIANRELVATFSLSADDVDRMSQEERIMRWLYLRYCQFRSQVEPLAFQSPKQIIMAKTKIEAVNSELLSKIGAKSSLYPIALPLGILACRNFERRVKFIQTIEAIRDHASRNDGALPAKLDALTLPAPNDPFTEQPFIYELNGKTARLHQAEIDGCATTVYDYELRAKSGK